MSPRMLWCASSGSVAFFVLREVLELLVTWIATNRSIDQFEIVVNNVLLVARTTGSF
jgi:hypothetical protein